MGLDQYQRRTGIRGAPAGVDARSESIPGTGVDAGPASPRTAMRHGAFMSLLATALIAGDPSENSPASGYRGIWYSIGQGNGQFGPKYSGGLGTYPANILPMACYAKEVETTFFVYGGTTEQSQTDLQIMIGRFDHRSGTVSRPTTIRNGRGFSDAHANPALAIGPGGHLFVFSSTRHNFDGRIYRSVRPYDIGEFAQVHTQYMAYAQPWYDARLGFTFLHTQYSGQQRFLFTTTSADGLTWTPSVGYAQFKGHYQTSCRFPDGTIGTAFNYHPGGVDTRTNLYYMQTADGGRTWTTIDGAKLAIPLKAPANPALAWEAEKDRDLVYIQELTADAKGRPVIVLLTSKDEKSGPASGVRQWSTVRWTGSAWERRPITTSDHNYDCGALFIEADGTWRLIGPTDPGPQPHGTGGEMVMWLSKDQGATWTRARQLTANSPRNHTYLRRSFAPDGLPHPQFYGLWADGDPMKESPSDLYFCNQAGDVFRLPRQMSGASATPERLGR